MNEQNEKLTAEEMWRCSHQFAHLTQDRNIPSELLTGVPFVMEAFAAQVDRDAAEAKADAQKGWQYSERLAKLLDEEKKITAELRKRLDAVIKFENAKHELLKKTQDELAEAQRKRDENYKFGFFDGVAYQKQNPDAITEDYREFILSRLSSGETKKES